MNNLEKSTTHIEQQKNFVIRFLYWSIIAIIVFLTGKYIFPVVLPLFFAAIISCILYRPINYIHAKIPINRKYICIVIVLIFFLITGFVFGLIGTQTIESLIKLLSAFPNFLKETVMPITKNFIKNFDDIFTLINYSFESNLEMIIQSFNDALMSISSTILAYLASIVTKVPSMFAKTIIMIIVTVFISIDFNQIRYFINKQIPDKQKILVKEAKVFINNTLIKCLCSYLFILSMTFIELYLGFTLLKINNTFLLALMISFVDILPVLGTGTILIPWGIILLLIGHYKMGLGILLIYTMITVIRNIVEPKLVGKQIGLHPVLTFAGMLIGLKYFGLVGMLGIPLIFSFIKILNDKKIIHLFNS